MKTDHEVRSMRNERLKGKTQAQAAARAGMSVRTARKYERLAQLPSQLKKGSPALSVRMAALTRPALVGVRDQNWRGHTCFA
jgi:transcriptional regulator with XRE-family HTH domain